MGYWLSITVEKNVRKIRYNFVSFQSTIIIQIYSEKRSNKRKKPSRQSIYSVLVILVIAGKFIDFCKGINVSSQTK